MKFQKSVPNFLTKVAEAMEIAVGAGVTDVEEQHTIDKQELEALENWWYERAHEPVSSWDDIRNDAARRYAEGQFSAFRLIHKTMFGDEKFSLRQWVEIEGPDGVNWDWKEEE